MIKALLDLPIYISRCFILYYDNYIEKLTVKYGLGWGLKFSDEIRTFSPIH